ncbi:MAG TPA: CARDB domain-containing protein [Thermoleophilaceae bacterium]|jgi:hypothetical protein
MALRPGLAMLAGLAVLAGTAATASAVGSAASDGAANARVVACATGDAPEKRLARFEGRMRAVKGTSRMSMRFRLVQKGTGGSAAQQVSDPLLGRWHRSRAGVDRFVYDQTVKGLVTGATYRGVVQFRWHDGDGDVIRRAERTTGDCVQDGDLSNLVVSSIKSGRGSKPGTALYSIAVANTGAGEAPAFGVALFLDGAVADSRTVDGLEPGESTVVKVAGPRCTRMRAVADRGDLVPETVEDDNDLRARC